MPRTTLYLVCLASLASVAFADRQPRFRAVADVVVVPAVVVDQDGRAVPGLHVEDFEVREDGRAVTISTFVPFAGDRGAPPEPGRFLVLLLDDLVAAQEHAWRMKDIARMFASRMGAADILAVVRLNGSQHATTMNRVEVERAIDTFQVGPKPLAGTTHLGKHALETIRGLAEQLVKVPHRRKLLVCIGAAGLFNPTDEGLPDAPPGYSEQWREAIRATTRANVSVYTIDPAGLSGRLPAYSGAIGFAGETGGEAFVNSNLFERAVERIWEEAWAYYLLGYQPERWDEKLHSIDVRVRRDGLQVRSRRSRG